MHCMWQKISFQLHILEIHLAAPRETNTDPARRPAETPLKSLEVHQWIWTPELKQQYFKWRFTEVASQDIGIHLVKVSCKSTIELLSFLESELSKARPVLTPGSWKMCSHKKVVNTAGKMYEQWVQALPAQRSAELQSAVQDTDRVQNLNPASPFVCHLCLLSDKAENIHYLCVPRCLL